MTRPTTTDLLNCCSSLRSSTLSDDQVETLAKAFSALADPVRLRLFSHIAANSVGSKDEVCACDLVAVAERSQPTVSHHMKVLVDSGLVQRDKRGLWAWYRVDADRLDALRAVLS